MKGTYSRHLLSAQPPSPHRMMPTDLVDQQPTESGCPEDGGTEADPEELARLSGGHCRADEMLVSRAPLPNLPGDVPRLLPGAGPLQ